MVASQVAYLEHCCYVPGALLHTTFARDRPCGDMASLSSAAVPSLHAVASPSRLLAPPTPSISLALDIAS